MAQYIVDLSPLNPSCFVVILFVAKLVFALKIPLYGIYDNYDIYLIFFMLVV